MAASAFSKLVGVSLGLTLGQAARIEGVTPGALTALLVESDPRHLADGFVIMSQGRYLGIGVATFIEAAPGPRAPEGPSGPSRAAHST